MITIVDILCQSSPLVEHNYEDLYNLTQLAWANGDPVFLVSKQVLLAKKGQIKRHETYTIHKMN